MRLKGWPRHLVLGLLYGAVLWLAGIVAFLLRFDMVVPVEYQSYLVY